MNRYISLVCILALSATFLTACQGNGCCYVRDGRVVDAGQAPAVDPDTRQIFIDMTTLRVPYELVEESLGDLEPSAEPVVMDREAAQMLLMAATKIDDVRVLQAPKLLALDGQTSTIFIGETIRFAKTDADAEDGFKIVDDPHGPINLGYALKVIAKLNADGSRIAIDLTETDRKTIDDLKPEQIAELSAEEFFKRYVREDKLESEFEMDNEGYVFIGSPDIREDKEGRYMRVSVLNARMLKEEGDDTSETKSIDAELKEEMRRMKRRR